MNAHYNLVFVLLVFHLSIDVISHHIFSTALHSQKELVKETGDLEIQG